MIGPFLTFLVLTFAVHYMVVWALNTEQTKLVKILKVVTAVIACGVTALSLLVIFVTLF
jgi:hypothetical protein